MSVIFDILTSPLGLNINPLAEWIIMFIIGEIAFRYAFYKVGDLDLGIPFLNFIAHWTIRIFIYVILWAGCRLITDGYNLISGLLKRIIGWP